MHGNEWYNHMGLNDWGSPDLLFLIDSSLKKKKVPILFPRMNVNI